MQGWHQFSRSPHRLASAVVAMTRLNRIRRYNTISFASTFKLYKSLVTSILLYGCETWILLTDSEKITQAFETKCLWKLLLSSYLRHKTSDWVRSKINSFVSAQEPLLLSLGENTAENSHELLSGSQETETVMVRACQTPRQPLQNHPSGHFGGWATTWSAEEILDGQHQRIDIPSHARTVHTSLMQKRLVEDLC